MKVAFSTSICPSWDLPTLIEVGRRHGYGGVELAFASSRTGSNARAPKSIDPLETSRQLQATGVEVICLGTAAALDTGDSEASSRIIAEVCRHIELAGELGCPFVRVYAASVGRGDSAGLLRERRETTLARISGAVQALLPHAVKHRVSVLVENAGEFADSASVWTILEAAGSPLVRCCWNPSAAILGHERSTTSIPRLGSKIGLVRVPASEIPSSEVPDTHSDGRGGNLDVPRTIQLLKGINYQGYLVVDRPLSPDQSRLGPVSPASSASFDAEAVLAAAAVYLRKLLDEKPVVLSAYKGDKFRPRQGYEFTGH